MHVVFLLEKPAYGGVVLRQGAPNRERTGHAPPISSRHRESLQRNVSGSAELGVWPQRPTRKTSPPRSWWVARLARAGSSRLRPRRLASWVLVSVADRDWCRSRPGLCVLFRPALGGL